MAGGCSVNSSVPVKPDDQIGQSGAGKDRVEYNAQTGDFVIDLGRDKKEVRFTLKRTNKDGTLEVSYGASDLSGAAQVELRARLEAQLEAAKQTSNDSLVEAITKVMESLRGIN